MWAPARAAMMRCSAGGMTLSSVATRYQLGRRFQAGGPDGEAAAPSVSGRRLAASTAPTRGGRSFANASGKSSGLT